MEAQKQAQQRKADSTAHRTTHHRLQKRGLAVEAQQHTQRHAQQPTMSCNSTALLFNEVAISVDSGPNSFSASSTARSYSSSAFSSIPCAQHRPNALSHPSRGIHPRHQCETKADNTPAGRTAGQGRCTNSTWPRPPDPPHPSRPAPLPR